MNPIDFRPLVRHLGTGLLAAGLLAVPASLLAPTARAADEPPSGEEDLQAKIQKKMQEILRLMRENGKAILDASQGGGGRPKGVEVTPPPTDGSPPPGSTPPPGGTPPPRGKEGTEPGGAGTDVRRRMEDLLKQLSSQGGAGAIPKELEELVRMIPRKSSSSSDGSPPPESGERKPGGKPKDPQDDPKKDPSKDPKENPERDPKPKDGDKPPPDGGKDTPRADDTPPWALELPPEVRTIALNASPESVPERFRAKFIRYQKWLQERASKARDGR